MINLMKRNILRICACHVTDVVLTTIGQLLITAPKNTDQSTSIPILYIIASWLLIFSRCSFSLIIGSVTFHNNNVSCTVLAQARSVSPPVRPSVRSALETRRAHSPSGPVRSAFEPRPVVCESTINKRTKIITKKSAKN